MVSVISGVGATVNKWSRSLCKHLNFYRLHLIIFTLTPLFFSVIFYLSNGRYKISYIDSLFNCVSAMAVCGLATVDLSTLTPWQQVILFIQMCIGSPVVASWVMVFIRRRYIRTSCSHVFADFMARKESEAQRKGSWRKLLCNLGIPSPTPTIDTDEERAGEREKAARPRTPQKLRPDMIRRMDEEPPMLINPSGRVTGPTPQIKVTNATPADSVESIVAPPSSSEEPSTEEISPADSQAKHSDPFPRAMTVEFADVPRPRLRVQPTIAEHDGGDTGDHASRRFSTNVPLSAHPSEHTTTHSHRTGHSPPSLLSTMHQGYGGFPMPHTIIKRLFRRYFPNADRRLTRTLTMPVTMSLVSHPTRQPYEKHASYIRENMRIGRNSQFDTTSISQNQLIEIAYMEYQALGLLLWVIAVYHIGCQLIGFVILAPYISASRWKGTFEPPSLVRPVNSVWFSAFQAVSAYTNTGTSLVDQSLLPFQQAYLMIFCLIFLILAGNTCFPIFLRFFIWILSKICKRDTDLHNILCFLLDHPRRCFLYLFPSHQTWFLLTVVILLTSIDWLFFLILDLGNVVLDALPVGARVLDGLMQAIAVRAAGFGIVPLAALAPAVKVLYVIMMYISVYPIAMSIRSTNVYEEKSLGVFHSDERIQTREENFRHEGPRMAVWSRYLAMHMKQQLAFDMWWIAISLFLLCIAESHHLTDPTKLDWFTIFNVLFELVSAYGTVGLSLGLPANNYSFSGSFRGISKLIICAVMIRGRHRGLPVAIDRAVMFPREYQDSDSSASNLDEDNQFDPDSASQTRSYSTQRELRRSITTTLTPIRSSKPSFPRISEHDEAPYIQANREGAESFRPKLDDSKRFKSSRPRSRTGSVDSSRSDTSSFSSYRRSKASSSASFADNEEPRGGASANDNHSVIQSLPNITTHHD